jgi:hypothetical protein
MDCAAASRTALAWRSNRHRTRGRRAARQQPGSARGWPRRGAGPGQRPRRGRARRRGHRKGDIRPRRRPRDGQADGRADTAPPSCRTRTCDTWCRAVTAVTSAAGPSTGRSKDITCGPRSHRLPPEPCYPGPAAGPPPPAGSSVPCAPYQPPAACLADDTLRGRKEAAGEENQRRHAGLRSGGQQFIGTGGGKRDWLLQQEQVAASLGGLDRQCTCASGGNAPATPPPR